MGLRPVLGRLLDAADDGPKAAGAAVLTHRFWTTSLNSDPSVIGRTIRLGPRTATVVGVLEPSVPYPADTEIIANVVTSPHHLGATMVTQRTHRMTELFGRLAPGASLEEARAELTAVARRDDARAPRGVLGESRRPAERDAAARSDRRAGADRSCSCCSPPPAVVFVIACSNVANLILARSVRREGELAVRAALGAEPRRAAADAAGREPACSAAPAPCSACCWRGRSSPSSRASPRASPCARSRSPSTPACSGSAPALAMAAAVLLAYVPRLPSPHAPTGLGLASGSVRITPGTNRRLRVFATTQIAFSFVLLAGAGMLLAALVALQTANTGYNLRQVLAFDLPTPSIGISDAQEMDFYQEVTRRIGELPGVEGVALGSFVPWRDAGSLVPASSSPPRATRPRTAKRTRTRGCGSSRPASSRCSACRCSPAATSPTTTARGSEPVVIVSQSVAQRLFPNGDAVNRTLLVDRSGLRQAAQPRRIVGVVADVDDENVVPRAGAHDLSPGAADAASRAACSCTRRAIRTRSCRR